MGYLSMYQNKLRSADNVAAMVKDGERIDYGYCATTSRYVDEALARRIPELQGLKITGGILQTLPEIFKADPTGANFLWQSVHLSSFERERYAKGAAVLLPMRYSELIRWYHENLATNDWIFVQTCPMDEKGYFNFGPSCSHLQAACRTARRVVVEINENMPVCLGENNAVHIDEVDFIVEGDNPPFVDFVPKTPGELDEKVARQVVELIPDGACLQLGIGTMPNAVGTLLLDAGIKDLGVHTEMYVDAFMELSLKGLINGRNKQYRKGLQSYTFAAGSRKLYEFMHNNQELFTAPVDDINDVRTISENPRTISINNAVNVDLFGQISSESSGLRAISGAGGQLDYVLGSYLAKEGASIICLSSTFTDKKGQMHSRILPTLQEGTIVTDTRSNAQWIITEHGAFNCKGKNVWERAEGLISIAHPDFQDSLTQEAEKAGIWKKSLRWRD